jgi:hypothetical protein
MVCVFLASNWNGKGNSVTVLGILSFFSFSSPRIFSCCKVFLSCHRDLSGGLAVQLFCIIALSTQCNFRQMLTCTILCSYGLRFLGVETV